jgi:hypothetical protein
MLREDLEEHCQVFRNDSDHEHPIYCICVVFVHLLDNSDCSHRCYQQHQRELTGSCRRELQLTSAVLDRERSLPGLHQLDPASHLGSCHRFIARPVRLQCQ